jgi:hypothetical protein
MTEVTHADNIKKWEEEEAKAKEVLGIEEPVTHYLGSDVNSDAEQTEIIALDEETMTLINTETGEVVGVADTPPETTGVVEIATWMGERRDWHKGKKAGLEAERQVHLDKIAAIYDSQIKRHTRAIAWFEEQYAPMLLELAKKLIGDAKKRSIAVGLLILKLGKTRPSVDVQDNDKAVAYLRYLISEQDRKMTDLEGQHKALKTDGASEEALAEVISKMEAEAATRKTFLDCLNKKVTVYKSNLPESLKVKLTDKCLEATGMVFNPGGEDKLTIE